MAKRFILFLTGISLFLSTSAPVFAAAPINEGAHLLTSSLPTDLVADPGTTVTTDIRVNNTGTESEPVKVGLMKFVAYGDTGQPRLLDREKGDDYFDWVTMTPSTFTLLPNQWQTVHVSIALPATAAFGYYYAVTFSKDSPAKVDNQQTGIGGGIASLILLEARSPDAKRAAEITEFSTTQKMYEFLPTTFTVKMKNTGNIHVAPIGDIFIDQGDTQNIGTVDINKDRGNILPDSNRTFTGTWNDGFPVYQDKVVNGATVLDSKGKPVQELHYDTGSSSKFRIGHYTAHIVMTYDDGTRDIPLEATTSFWVIPWRFLLIVGAVLLLLLAGIYSLIKNIVRRVRHS